MNWSLLSSPALWSACSVAIALGAVWMHFESRCEAIAYHDTMDELRGRALCSGCDLTATSRWLRKTKAYRYYQSYYRVQLALPEATND